MATLSKSISSKAWGDVDKTALGNAVGKAFASGDITRAQIKQVYLYVPDEAFDKDADGNPVFKHSLCKLPVAEFSGGAITTNRNGVHAAAAAMAGGRNMPDMPDAAMTTAKRRLRGLYRKMKETVPDSLKESALAIGRGRPFEELVKGSVEYTMTELRDAFEAAFKVPSPYSGTLFCPWSIVDTFADSIVVRAWGEWNDLAPDEYYRVTYSRDAAGAYTFAAEDQWEVVELTYQPQSAQATSEPAPVGEARDRKDLKRISEQLTGSLQFVEGRTIKAGRVMTANTTNGNRRRYPAAVLREATTRLKTHLHESAGQGRLRVQVLGEIDHPSDKGKQPSLLETVFKWDEVDFDGDHVSVAGHILETAKGRDVLALVEGGVQIPLSMRGYGDSKIIKENGQSVEEVTYLEITGFDGVVEPGFESAVAIVESQNQTTEDEKMTLEELKKLIGENPDLFKGLIKEDLDKMGADALKALEERVRGMLGIEANADLGKALQEAVDAKKQLEEQKHKATIEAAITEATKGLPYGDNINKAFVEAVRSANPQDEKAVKAIVEAKRKEYDAIAAEARLAAMGRRGSSNLIVAPVLESELGIPEFARGMHEFTEALVKAGHTQRRDFRTPKTVNEAWTARLLERFDALHEAKLKQESRLLQEAEQTSDLNLPYSVSRTIIAAVGPQLIAVSVFDAAPTDQNPTRVFYESYAHETGVTTVVTDESVVTAHDTWVALDYKRLTPGTVVVTSSPAGTTYDENDDFIIDYANGKLMTLSTGTIGAADTVLVDYTYSAIRKGEMQPIERGKGQLAYIDTACEADRLATQISNEAVLYARSQVGWDAVTRTLSMLIDQVKRKIDQGILYMGLSAALSVANNSGGTWNSGASPLDYADLVAKVGVARVKVTNRYYKPTGIVMSTTMSDTAANWENFTASGARPDQDINAEGYVGRLKGLPVFETTEFTDDFILVANRELVAYRVFSPMVLKGPFPSFDTSTLKLLAAEQWYEEEHNATVAPVPEKGSYVRIS